MTKDMTQGSPLKLILAFAVPLMLGSLFQQFYNLADTIIVGRFVGVDALAAVGSVGGLNYLVLGFVNGIARRYWRCNAASLCNPSRRRSTRWGWRSRRRCR